MDGNRRHPLPPLPAEPERPAATDAERERMDAAMRAGWQFRFDPVRDEYTAARELHTARKLGELLDAIEAGG